MWISPQTPLFVRLFVYFLLPANGACDPADAGVQPPSCRRRSSCEPAAQTERKTARTDRRRLSVFGFAGHPKTTLKKSSTRKKHRKVTRNSFLKSTTTSIITFLSGCFCFYCQGECYRSLEAERRNSTGVLFWRSILTLQLLLIISEISQVYYYYYYLYSFQCSFMTNYMRIGCFFYCHDNLLSPPEGILTVTVCFLFS